MQAVDGGLGAFGQHLVLGDERAVDVGQDQRDLGRFCHDILGLSRGRRAQLVSGRQARPSRASSSSAAAGPSLPAL